jgi:electron transport complex protein RnfG
MTEAIQTHTTSPASSGKMLQAMVGIGIFCALMIVLTYVGTLPRIEKLRAEALEKAIFKVIPGITKTETYQLNENQSFSLVAGEDEPAQIVYAGYDENNELVGLAIEASGQGYADILRILYGYDPDEQKIIGFYVLESKETPGLGDKIEKDENFLANFEALSVTLTDDQSAIKNTVVTVKQGTKENPWEVDGITGATISSRAIGNIIGTSTAQWIPLIYQNQEAFTTPNSDE